VDRILAEHCLGNFSLEKETDSSKFMLTNNGGYFYHNPESKYRGLYFPEKGSDKNWSLFKTIDEIRLECKDKALINKFGHYERLTDKGIIKYYFFKDSLIIESSAKGEFVFSFDMRDIYDFNDAGRIYNILEEKGCIIIEYKKFDSNVLETLHYTRYLAIKTDITNLEKINQWRESYYKEDETRRSYPWKLYVLDSFKLKANRKSRIAFSFSDDMAKAVESAKEAFEKAEFPVYEEKKISTTIERAIAYNCAVKSVEDLYVDFNYSKGFYAGLPWFFQFWTRDEAISMKAVMLLEKIQDAKDILMKRISTLDEKGRLPNRFPYSQLATADGTGWVFKRLYDLMSLLEEKNTRDGFIKKEELVLIREQLKNSIKRHFSLSENLLIKNSANETWMDTSYEGDTRQGFRIEIQALWLSMLKLSNYLDEALGEEKEFKKLEDDTKKAVKYTFFDGNILRDGKDDPTIRPNFFLAYYVYPELLINEEWEKVFENCLPKLWLDWGGLSTIDKSSRLFCPNYTGEDNKSYHRGDSWFFLNNIAAICMLNLNKEKYKEYTEKIISAGVRDILSKGIIGRPSEISSASVQMAEGSLFQLWSAATFVELMKEN
jgi:predicted glycogen debranching enzyme